MLEFIIAFFLFAFIGNGFLSLLLKSKKSIQLSILENTLLSFGIGVNFVILFFYAIDIFQITDFFFIILLPIIIGFVVKLWSIPTKFRWNHITWEEIKTYFKLNWKKVKSFFSKKSILDPNLSKKDRYTNIFIWILIFATSFLILNKIGEALNSNYSQLAWDPNMWVNIIVKFRDTPYIDYPTLSAYPAGFVIFCGFLLYLFPSTGFFDQFYFLKMLPFYNLVLCLVILYPISKRLFKNNMIFYIIVILLISQRFFIYRTIMLLPSILLTTQFEILILMLVIDDLPRPIVYFSLASMILIHTANAGFVLILFFGYLLLNKFLSIVKKSKEKMKDRPEAILDISNKKVETLNTFKNLIAFLIPISVWMINLTIRYDPHWYTSFLSYLGISSLLNSILALILSILDLLMNFFWGVGSKIVWVDNWGGMLALGAVFYLVLIWGFFHKFRREKSNTTKSAFIKFAKFTVFVTLFIWFLPVVNYLLDPLKGIQIIESIYNLLNSTIFNAYAERIFEVVGPINALFGALIFEEIYFHFSKKPAQNQASMDGKQKNVRPHHLNERTFLSITLGCLIVINFFEIPYYEYNFETDYAEGVVFFRQYLDANGTPGEMVGYCGNNSQVRDLLIYFVVTKYPIEPINCTINATIARTQYLENISSPLIYLVLDRNDDNNWEDLLVSFSGSSNLIYARGRIIILKK